MKCPICEIEDIHEHSDACGEVYVCLGCATYINPWGTVRACNTCANNDDCPIMFYMEDLAVDFCSNHSEQEK